MKSAIPPEIDSLMWAVAESRDPNAADNFVSRHPQYKSELGQRIATVRALKGSKPPAPLYSRRFRPSQPPVPVFARFRWAAASVALAGVAVAAYYGGMAMFDKKPVPVTAVQGSSDVVTNFPKQGNDLEYRPNNSSTTVQNPPPTVPDDQPSTPPERTFTLKLEDISLTDALESIGMQTAFSIDVAPGFPNPKVTIDYRDATLDQILMDMGQRFGFTPFKQGKSEYLLIPAVDKNTPFANGNEGVGVGIDARPGSGNNSGLPD